MAIGRARARGSDEVSLAIHMARQRFSPYKKRSNSRTEDEHGQRQS